MGHANAKLLMSCDRARKAGDVEAHQRLTAEVERSQRECPHPPADHKSAKVTTANHIWRVGDMARWCLRCSKPLNRSQ